MKIVSISQPISFDVNELSKQLKKYFLKNNPKNMFQLYFKRKLILKLLAPVFLVSFYFISQ